jgi:hypothetical protein
MRAGHFPEPGCIPAGEQAFLGERMHFMREHMRFPVAQPDFLVVQNAF